MAKTSTAFLRTGPMKISPCKGCSRRFVGCHQNCSDYHSWKGEVEAFAAWREKQRLIQDYDKETQKRLQVRRKYYMSSRGSDD